MKTKIQSLSNAELLTKTRELIQRERELVLHVLLHMQEIERRKLYLEKGYASLFEFTVQNLGYGEDAAYRRIQAMRLLKSIPEIQEKMAAGSINLTTASRLQKFFYDQAKEQEMPAEDKLELIQSVENKSSLEVRRELAKRSPQIILQETLRAINELEYELRMIIDAPLKEKLDHLKSLLSHKDPKMPYQKLFRELADLGLVKWDPLKQKAISGEEQKRIEDPHLEIKSNYIPTQLRRAVWIRDHGCCSFVDSETKKRCGSRHLLQIDHVKPLALGGGHQFNNLRLLCSAHNQHRAAKTFGPLLLSQRQLVTKEIPAAPL